MSISHSSTSHTNTAYITVDIVSLKHKSHALDYYCLLNDFLRYEFLSLRAEDESRHIKGSNDVENIVSE